MFGAASAEHPGDAREDAETVFNEDGDGVAHERAGQFRPGRASRVGGKINPNGRMEPQKLSGPRIFAEMERIATLCAILKGPRPARIDDLEPATETARLAIACAWKNP